MTNESNAERAKAIVEHWNPDIPRDDWKPHIEYFAAALSEAEARGYERAMKELAAKESEISRAAYERAIEDAATLVDRHCGADHVWESLDEVAAMIRAIYAREESNDRP